MVIWVNLKRVSLAASSPSISPHPFLLPAAESQVFLMLDRPKPERSGGSLLTTAESPSRQHRSFITSPLSGSALSFILLSKCMKACPFYICCIHFLPQQVYFDTGSSSP